MPLGLDNRPLDAVSTEGIAIVFGDAPSSSLRPDHSTLLAYARTNDTFHRRHTILPMRYGSLFKGLNDLSAFVHARRGLFRERLAHLAGCSEFTMRILASVTDVKPAKQPPTEVAPSLGKSYFAERRTHHRAREQHQANKAVIRDEAIKVFGRLYRDTRLEDALVNGNSLVSLHFLVPKNAFDDFRAVFEDYRASTAFRLLLTGPWPPYNFADCDD